MKKILTLGAGTGGVTVANMLRRRLDLKQWSITVKNLMTRDVITVSVETSLPAVADLLTKQRFSGLPVVEPDGKLVGVVTEADLLSALNIKGEPVTKKILDTITGKGRAKRRLGTVVEDIMTLNQYVSGNPTLLKQQLN